MMHKAVNHQACACGWSAKKNGHRGWEDRRRALDKHLRDNPIDPCSNDPRFSGEAAQELIARAEQMLRAQGVLPT